MAGVKNAIEEENEAVLGKKRSCLCDMWRLAARMAAM